MNIRQANRFDLPEVLRMLKDFRNCTPIESSSEYNDEEYFNKLYRHILLGGGLAFVAEKDDRLVGMIIGIKDLSIWDPNTKLVRELAFYVDQEHRGSSAGYRLLKEYTRAAQQLVEDDHINMYTMTTLENSPNIKLDKFGYKRTETIWVGGV